MPDVNVKLLGLFRLDSGLHELRAHVERVRDLYPLLLEEARRAKPDTTVTRSSFSAERSSVTS